MALINGIYVFVDSGGETVSRGIKVSEHPVEKGLDLTDNIKRLPVTISFSGEIVGENAADTIKKLTALHQSGKYIRYSGRNILHNAIIEDFETSHPIDVYGGCEFSMKLREIRVAKPAYIANKSGTRQIQNNTDKKHHTVKQGDCLWDISAAYYGSGALFNKIYEANRDKIKDPHWIYPGQVFLIP